MPIKISPPPKAIFQRLTRHISKIIKAGSIPLPTNEDNTHIASVIAIQQVANYDQVEIRTSQPEGYRVLLSQNGNIITAIDFYYKGKRLYFLKAFNGPVLDNFIIAINTIEEIYRKVKAEKAITIVEFLHAKTPYVAVSDNKTMQIYTYSDKLKKITSEKLQEKLLNIKKSLQPILISTT